MTLDAKHLRDFYRTPLGQVVRRQLSSHIRSRWKSVSGETLIGAGFAAPYLGSFRSEVHRLCCLMPARQGAVVWPAGARCQSVLVEERYWPIPDATVDRLLAIHCLEQSERAGSLLREMWRVLKPDGRLLLVVPNRRGLWSRMDITPFGHGLPFSRTQLQTQMTDALFTPTAIGEALYFPPVDRRVLLRVAPACERFGAKLSLGIAGVIIAEARKELVAPVAGGLKTREVNVLNPLESGAPNSGSRAGSVRASGRTADPVD